MDDDTLVALKESISHWERMRVDPACEEGATATDCALCRKFLLGPRRRCDGCPVMAKRGEPRCWETPYMTENCRFKHDVRRNSDASWASWCAAADKEIAFLKSLLPPATAPQQYRFVHAVREEEKAAREKTLVLITWDVVVDVTGNVWLKCLDERTGEWSYVLRITPQGTLARTTGWSKKMDFLIIDPIKSRILLEE